MRKAYTFHDGKILKRRQILPTKNNFNQCLKGMRKVLRVSGIRTDDYHCTMISPKEWNPSLMNMRIVDKNWIMD